MMVVDELDMVGGGVLAAKDFRGARSGEAISGRPSQLTTLLQNIDIDGTTKDHVRLHRDDHGTPAQR